MSRQCTPFGLQRLHGQSKLLEVVRSLATYPEHCVTATEDQQFQRVRPGTVHESDENDPPTVRVRHIWHGTRSPITFWPAEDE